MIKHFLFDKKGVTSIFTILWLAVLFPFLMFVVIDISHYTYEIIHLKAVTDNAAASAVTQIDESLVPQGVLQIDPTEATQVAETTLQTDLNLNSDWTPKDNSIFSGTPTVKINVVNVTSPTGINYPTPVGNLTIYHPSVVIYAEYPLHGLFFQADHVTIQKVGVSQVQFKTS